MTLDETATSIMSLMVRVRLIAALNRTQTVKTLRRPPKTTFQENGENVAIGGSPPSEEH